MNREGIQEADLSSILQEIQSHPTLTVEGVLSHFFDADDVSDHAMIDQMKCFKRMYYKILDAGCTPIRRHIGNSAAIFKLNDDFFNAYRPGIALYGYTPLSDQDSRYVLSKKLLPVLSITSRIISIQTIWPGE